MTEITPLPSIHLWQALDAAWQQAVGHKLFTASYLDYAARQALRIYSSRPEAYPAGGSKPMIEGDDWLVTMQRGECFIANRPEAFGAHFTDLAQIVALGFASVVNVPVRIDRQLVGTLNLLDAADAYIDEAKVHDAYHRHDLLAQQAYCHYIKNA